MATTKDRPNKPYSEYPLFPHACGQWAKKIKGKLYYFGVWADPDAALDLFLQEKDALYGGRTTVRAGVGTPVANIMDMYLEQQESKVQSKQIVKATFDDYYAICKTVTGHWGKHREVGTLRPVDFGKLATWLNGEFSPSRATKIVTVTRQIFKWAYESELIDSMPRFGPDFKGASKKAQRKHRAKSPKKLFSREDIRP